MTEAIDQPIAPLPAEVRAGLVQWVQHELANERRSSTAITTARKELRATALRLRELAEQLDGVASRKIGQPIVMLRTSELRPEERPPEGQFVIGRFEDKGLRETAQRMRQSADDCEIKAKALPNAQGRPWRRQVSALFLRQHLLDRGPFPATKLPLTLSEDGPLVAEFVSLLRDAGYRRSTISTKRTLEWLLEARQTVEQEFEEILRDRA